MPEQEFAGRSALITGAASGIGAAIARWLDARGIGHLVLVDMDAEGIEALDLCAKTTPYVGDVSEEDLWNRIESELDGLDHAVINAGIAEGIPIVTHDFADWRKILSVNLDGAFLALRASLRLMLKGETGEEAGKSIVMTSSVAGIKPLGFTSAYGSSKAGVAHLARIAAAEHAKDGIRINAVAPGRVDTPIWTRNAQFRQLVEQLGSHEAAMASIAEEASPLGRVASADEMAGQMGFLLSRAAWNITGTVLVSDGGYTL
jgi:NAD(P)-dependent dehydrogenase (short-subunit alcohol dehydrogenase family)